MSSLTFLKILSYKGPNIYEVHTEREWGGLEICHVFIDPIVFKQQIYCSFLQIEGGYVCGFVVCGLVVSGYHNCMIRNNKTYFEK